MKITNINISNKFIDYSNVCLDFSMLGVYFLVGNNGTGKSSLIENIIFDDNRVLFNNKNYDYLYRYKRYKLFAYVPQKIMDCDLNVKEYLFRENPNANIESAKELLYNFKMDNVLFSQSFASLSGGEKIKLTIISELLKDTPFVFMDEPTNYLDDNTVEILKIIISKFSNSKTIIIATHDPRLMNINSTKIELDGKNVVIHENDFLTTTNTTITSQNTKETNFKKIALKKITRPTNIITFLLVLLISCFFTAYYQYSYSLNFSLDKTPPQNLITIYSADYSYGDLNKAYCESQNITIKKEKTHNLIYVNDLQAISEIDGCQKIYIKDYPKYLEFSTLLNKQKQIDEYSTDNEQDFILGLNVFSLPEIIYKDSVFLNQLALTDFSYLEEGRLPIDNALETSISKRLLTEFYDYDEQSVKNAIGDTININGTNYTIVGFQLIDVCLVSYSENTMKYGFYEYKKETFSEFSNYYLDYLKKNNMQNLNIDCLAVLTEQGKEEKILNYLIENYPANNYYSYHFVNSWVNNNNTTYEKELYLLFIPISLILGICYFLIQRQVIVINFNRLYVYMNYYINAFAIKKYFVAIIILGYLFVIIINTLFSLLCNLIFGMFPQTFLLNIITITILLLPSCIYIATKFLFSKKKGNLK